MTTEARGSNISNGAIVSIGAPDSTPQIIHFECNSSTLKRSFQPQMSESDENVSSEAVRFIGPPVKENQSKLLQGEMDVTPPTPPKAYFMWGSTRVQPVRLQAYFVVEQMFDRELLPFRTTVSLDMLVLSNSDISDFN